MAVKVFVKKHVQRVVQVSAIEDAKDVEENAQLCVALYALENAFSIVAVIVEKHAEQVVIILVSVRVEAYQSIVNQNERE